MEQQEYKVKIEQFQGPLDLLLQLIMEEELDITQISLAKVTEQYIKHLEKVEEVYPEELADFLVVATKLLLIKSRSLLPYLEVDDDEEETDLEEQLKIYRQFHEAALLLEQRIDKKNFTYGRVDKRFKGAVEPSFSPPEGLKSNALKTMFEEVLAKLEPVIKLPEKALRRALTLKERICHLQVHLEKEAQVSFQKIIGESKDKGEVILSFLAILELVKKEMVCVTQNQAFEDISIAKINKEDNDN